MFSQETKGDSSAFIRAIEAPSVRCYDLTPFLIKAKNDDHADQSYRYRS